jgi:hypothetical protein
MDAEIGMSVVVGVDEDDVRLRLSEERGAENKEDSKN